MSEEVKVNTLPFKLLCKRYISPIWWPSTNHLLHPSGPSTHQRLFANESWCISVPTAAVSASLHRLGSTFTRLMHKIRNLDVCGTPEAPAASNSCSLLCNSLSKAKLTLTGVWGWFHWSKEPWDTIPSVALGEKQEMQSLWHPNTICIIIWKAAHPDSQHSVPWMCS